MSTLPWLAPDRIEQLRYAASKRILILDGGMGTMLQAHKLVETDYRGQRFAKHSSELKGNNDLLSLTRPELIQGVHEAYLAAGADLIETNTFNATRISQADYQLESLVPELNRHSATLARKACQTWQAQTPQRPRFAIGVLGPTSRTASISPDVNDPGFRNVDYQTLADNYLEAAAALLNGGADLLMVETVFDTLNAKAALSALSELFRQRGGRVPVMVSGTITDRSGRTLSGQTAEAFYYSIRHVRPWSVGLNCALGAEDLRPHLQTLAQVADCQVSTHPNAGLPNAFGEYDETPEQMASVIASFAQEGLLNIVGGCCGTTPEHIRAIAQAVAALPPRSAAR